MTAVYASTWRSPNDHIVFLAIQLREAATAADQAMMQVGGAAGKTMLAYIPPSAKQFFFENPLLCVHATIIHDNPNDHFGH